MIVLSSYKNFSWWPSPYVSNDVEIWPWQMDMLQEKGLFSVSLPKI